MDSVRPLIRKPELKRHSGVCVLSFGSEVSVGRTNLITPARTALFMNWSHVTITLVLPFQSRQGRSARPLWRGQTRPAARSRRWSRESPWAPGRKGTDSVTVSVLRGWCDSVSTTTVLCQRQYRDGDMTASVLSWWCDSVSTEVVMWQHPYWDDVTVSVSRW